MLGLINALQDPLEHYSNAIYNVMNLGGVMVPH